MSLMIFEQLKEFLRKLRSGDEVHHVIQRSDIKDRFVPTYVEPDKTPISTKFQKKDSEKKKKR